MIRRSFLKACAAVSSLMSLLGIWKPDEIVSVRRGDMGEVFDADGRKIEKCIEANLSTGRCVVFKTGHDGEMVLNSRGNDVERLTIEFIAPLRFKRRSGFVVCGTRD